MSIHRKPDLARWGSCCKAGENRGLEKQMKKSARRKRRKFPSTTTENGYYFWITHRKV